MIVWAQHVIKKLKLNVTSYSELNAPIYYIFKNSK